MKRGSILLASSLVTAGAAFGQSSVDATNKHAWGENIGWTNWRDAGSPAGAQGVVVHATYLSGFAWAENVGWINLGDGTPANGAAYANTTGMDFGVNRDAATGSLSGLAWGENIGWINFAGGALASPANPARLVNESGACRLRGYAWGENVGWISLDGNEHFVGIPGACDDACNLAADLDSDGDVDLSDLTALLANYGTLAGAEYEDGDLDGDEDVDLSDLTVMLSEFGTLCP
jgi:hypothetical protein